MKVVVRPARTGDLDSIFEVSLTAHRENYKDLIPLDKQAKYFARYQDSDENRQKFATKFANYLADSDWHIWVAEMDGVVIGFTLAHVESPDFVKKCGLFVHPDWQGVGAGKALFLESLKTFDTATIQLSVIKSNLRAKSMYQRHGFEFVRYKDKLFYGATQIVMQRKPISK